MENVLYFFLMFFVLFLGFCLGQSSRDDDLKEALRVNPVITVQEFTTSYKIDVSK
jgi:hypothetical protein